MIATKACLVAGICCTLSYTWSTLSLSRSLYSFLEPLSARDQTIFPALMFTTLPTQLLHSPRHHRHPHSRHSHHLQLQFYASSTFSLPFQSFSNQPHHHLVHSAHSHHHHCHRRPSSEFDHVQEPNLASEQKRVSVPGQYHARR